MEAFFIGKNGRVSQKETALTSIFTN